MQAVPQYFGQGMHPSQGLQGMGGLQQLPQMQQMQPMQQIAQQPVMSAPSPMLLPEFSFNPASPGVFPDPTSQELQQHNPALPTLSSLLREMEPRQDNTSPGHVSDAHHAPAEKTLSAIVREIVNDQTIVPPRNPNDGLF